MCFTLSSSLPTVACPAAPRPACSPSVVRNLALLDEDRLDFDLLEDLVAHIDESQEGQEGAILVFLPGGRCSVLRCAVMRKVRKV